MNSSRMFKNSIVTRDLGGDQLWFYNVTLQKLFGIIRGRAVQNWKHDHHTSQALNTLNGKHKYPHYLCPVCAQIGVFNELFDRSSSLSCPQNHKIKHGDEKSGIDLTRQHFPWNRPIFEDSTMFPHDHPEYPGLQAETLYRNETNQLKRNEFEYVSQLVTNFLDSDSRESKTHAEWMDIEKIVVLKNQNLETRFIKKFGECLHSVHYGPSPATQPKEQTSVPDQWNSSQTQILRTFQSYTGRMAGNEGINLILGWQGNTQKTNYLIAQGGQKTHKEKGEAGIHLTDEGYFGRGVYFTQYPSYGLQYAGEHECLLLSWVLMGKVYPVTESVSSPKTLLGQEIQAPFNSHYVLVKRSKNTSFADVAKFDEKQTKFDADGDEIVIKESCQSLPRYIISFKRQQKNVNAASRGLDEESRNASQIIYWISSDVAFTAKMKPWLETTFPTFQGSIVNFFLGLEALCAHIERLKNTKIWDQYSPKTKIVVSLTTSGDLATIPKIISKLTSDILSPERILIFIGEQTNLYDPKDHKKTQESLAKQIPEVKKTKFVFSQNKFNLLKFCCPSPSSLEPFALDFELSPSLLRGTLQHVKISILRGVDLISCDVGGKSDPYCIFGFVYPGTNIHQTPTQTKHRPNTLSPIWADKHNNSTTYHFIHLPACEFLIVIRDHDRIGSHDPMGELRFTMKDLLAVDKQTGQKEFLVERGAAKKSKAYGRLVIEWKFQSEGCDATCARGKEAFKSSTTFRR